MLSFLNSALKHHNTWDSFHFKLEGWGWGAYIRSGLIIGSNILYIGRWAYNRGGGGGLKAAVYYVARM